MIHIDIFLFAACLFFVGILCLLVGAGLRDARARKERNEDIIYYTDQIMKRVHIIRRYMDIDRELQRELKEAQGLWNRIFDDHSRGRIQALRHMILYLRGRI